jgi:hypothetical protein
VINHVILGYGVVVTFQVWKRQTRNRGTGSFPIVTVFLPTNRLRFVFYPLSTGLLRLSHSPLLTNQISQTRRPNPLFDCLVCIELPFSSLFLSISYCCFFLVFYFFRHKSLLFKIELVQICNSIYSPLSKNITILPFNIKCPTVNRSMP